MSRPETFTAEPSRASATLDRKQRLEKGVLCLALIDEWRRATNNPNAGLATERLLVGRELLELDDLGLRPTPAETPRVVRNVVIPVRRIPGP